MPPDVARKAAHLPYPHTGEGALARFEPKLGNAGLWFEKYFDLPAKAESKDRGEILQRWLKGVGKAVGCATLLQETSTRRRLLLCALGGQPRRYVTRGPFLPGIGTPHAMENGLLWHSTLGVPYLPASGLKGLLRAWAKEVDLLKGSPDGKRLERAVFGNEPSDDRAKSDEIPETVGEVIFLDLLPTKPVALVAEVMTPHYGPWYQNGLEKPGANPPADWHNPIPIPLLAVGDGQRFETGLALRPGSTVLGPDDLRTLVGWLDAALETMGAGAKTATGYGTLLPTI